jgi:hypothetical protein
LEEELLFLAAQRSSCLYFFYPDGFIPDSNRAVSNLDGDIRYKETAEDGLQKSVLLVKNIKASLGREYKIMKKTRG